MRRYGFLEIIIITIDLPIIPVLFLSHKDGLTAPL